MPQIKKFDKEFKEQVVEKILDYVSFLLNLQLPNYIVSWMYDRQKLKEESIEEGELV